MIPIVPALIALVQNPAQPPRIVSPEVGSRREITFRLVAPDAKSVRLVSPDLQNLSASATLVKGENGVWQTTVAPAIPGAYRYQFNVDGATSIDSKNPATSESLDTSWSLVVVSGSETLDTADVPHGAVAEVAYHSKSLNRARRLHVYTPPGYEKDRASYPVFYLLHGSGDSDDSWTTVGRAGFLLDNLIAQKKAVPMIVVMPAGHTRSQNTPGPAAAPVGAAPDEFSRDFTEDIVPLIESRYRVKTDRNSRAIAGLSMGGFQTLEIAVPRLKDFGYVGVYSSGLFGIVPRTRPGAPAPTAPSPATPFAWETDNRKFLTDASAKKGLKLLWFGCGKGDFLLQTNLATVELFKKYGFPVEYRETDGGHTWLNWRDYLTEFAQRLFR